MSRIRTKTHKAVHPRVWDFYYDGWDCPYVIVGNKKAGEPMEFVGFTDVDLGVVDDAEKDLADVVLFLRKQGWHYIAIHAIFDQHHFDPEFPTDDQGDEGEGKE